MPLRSSPCGAQFAVIQPFGTKKELNKIGSNSMTTPGETLRVNRADLENFSLTSIMILKKALNLCGGTVTILVFHYSMMIRGDYLLVATKRYHFLNSSKYSDIEKPSGKAEASTKPIFLLARVIVLSSWLELVHLLKRTWWC